MYILGIGNEGVARGGRRFELYDEGAWSVGGGDMCFEGAIDISYWKRRRGERR
jgi:hypothetical protein